MQERALSRAAVQPSFVGFEAPDPERKLRVSDKSVEEGSALSLCIVYGDIDAIEDAGITGGEVVRVGARHLPYTRNGERVDRVLAFLYGL